MDTPAPRVCTLGEFTEFFNSRAYDLIGEGSFRKHLTHCKEAADVWAVDMVNAIHAVTDNVKAVNSQLARFTMSSPTLVGICKNVIISAQPPVRMHIGEAVCAITQQRCSQCMNLSSGKKCPPTLVHVRFCRFFMFIWFVAKIEYVVRSCIRTWLLAQADECTYESVAKNVHELAPTIARIHSVFVVGFQHVMASFERLDEYNKEPVITLPPGTLPPDPAQPPRKRMHSEKSTSSVEAVAGAVLHAPATTLR